MVPIYVDKTINGIVKLFNVRLATPQQLADSISLYAARLSPSPGLVKHT